MTPVRACAWLLLSTLLTATLASAAPKTKARAASRASAPASRAAAPASSERSNAAALSDALQRHLAAAGLTDSLAGYRISPSLTQLRRYVEAKQLRLVCIVDLSLLDGEGSLLATVQGSATATGATPREAIDAATHAAVARLPRALQALRGNSSSAPVADARRQWELPLK